MWKKYKAYFNVLFGIEYIVNGYNAYENGSFFLGAANML